jgi:hypothetical protein
MPTSQGIGGELMFLDLVSEVARDRASAKPAVRETEGPITEPAPMALEAQHPPGDGKHWTLKNGELKDEAIGPTTVVA